MRCVPGSCSPGSVSDLALVLEVARVDLDVTLPLVRELILGEAGVHRAGLDAGVAVDALFRIDVELLDLVVIRLVRSRMDAVDGADLDARIVLLPDTGLCDHVSHVAGNLANACRELTFRYGDHLSDARRAREAPGREARDRPEARAARPVPDRALPGSHRRAEPRVRPGELGLHRLRRGRQRADAQLGR